MLLQHQLVQNPSVSLQITPGLVQKLSILQMSSADIAAYVQEQMMENPVMEADFASDFYERRGPKPSKFSEWDKGPLTYDSSSAPSDTLEMACLSQLRIGGAMQERHYRIAAFLLGNLNDDGFLNIGLEEASRLLREPLEEVEKALAALHLLEPAGIGARSLQECLQIQIARDPGADPWAYRIVEHFLHELGRGKLQRIAGELGISVDDVRRSLAYIRTLNPRPGLAFYRQPVKFILPDAFITKEHGGRYSITMNKKSLPKVYINSYYRQLRLENEHNVVKPYIDQHIQSARWLIHCLEQRKDTLQRVIEAIVLDQSLFLDKGISYLKPMTMKAIAEKLHFNESTISRAVQNKWIQTPQGLFELKYFFSNGLSVKQGDAVSATSIKEKIRELIDKENKNDPLSDQQITSILQRQGIEISRRTVMKYREELNLLSSRLRRIS